MVEIIDGGITTPQGFKAAGVHSGVKYRSLDLGLLYSSVPATAYCAYTSNNVKAAPVQVMMAENSPTLSAVVVNSGNANALTGHRGIEDAYAMKQAVAAELNLPVEKIIEANRTAADTLSLDTPVGDEEDTSIGSFVEDERTPGPADATSNALLAEALKEILDTLTEREADVLRMRFGMYDGRTHTLEEVGQIFGVTRERIRQIENKAIRKLRHPSRAKKIRDFYC